MPTTDPTSRTLPGQRSRQRKRHRQSLPVALLLAVTPAYFLPALTTYVNTLVISDRQVADRLAVAAWTTIAIPSAAAAGLVTLWMHRRTPPAQPVAGDIARAFAAAALACALLGSAVSAVLIGNGVLPLSALQFTVTSAALGGGLAARRWARSNRPQRGRRARRTARADRTALPTGPAKPDRSAAPLLTEPTRLVNQST
jgi:hypothetical protein